jgi:hypothetical protein
VKTLLVIGIIMGSAPTAMAQEIDYSTQSFKNLALLRSSATNISLPPDAQESFFAEEGFDLFGWDSES